MHKILFLVGLLQCDSYVLSATLSHVTVDVSLSMTSDVVALSHQVHK